MTRPMTPAAARNRYLFGGVVAGIAGYGNCIGIPDVGGEVTFDPTYSGNPLVNAMCVGIARHDDITLARAAGTGSVLLLVGAATGRDGIQGASFASATLGEDREERRPAVQVGNPFLEKLLMEACLELAALDGVVAMQDLGAAGLTCALAELTARGGVGAEVDLDRVPRRERGMTPYEVLLSESQERMLVVVRPDAVAAVRAVFARYELEAAAIGEITDGTLIRCRAGGEVVCEVAGRALADDAPRYRIGGVARDPEPVDLEPLAAEPASASVLLELLASPNARDRKPIWRRYDHMNGTNTLVGPGRGDAALLRLKGTAGALALAIDGPGPGAPRRARPVPGRRLGRPRGRPQRRLLGRDPDRHHRLPELRLAGDRSRRVAAGAGDRRHRRRVPAARPAGRLRQRQPLQRDAGRTDPAHAGGRHGRPARGPIARGADGVARRRRDLAHRRPGRRRRRAGGLRAGLEPGAARRPAVTRRRGGRARRGAPAAPRRGRLIAASRTTSRSAGWRWPWRASRSRPDAARRVDDRDVAADSRAVRRAGRAGDRRPAARRTADRLRAALADAGVPGRRIGVAGGERLEITAGGEPCRSAWTRSTEAWRQPF